MLTVAVHFTSFGFHANTFTRTRIRPLLDPKHGLCYKRYNSSLVTVHIYCDNKEESITASTKPCKHTTMRDTAYVFLYILCRHYSTNWGSLF